MKPYLNIQEAIRDFSDRIERLEAAIEEREQRMALHFDLKVNGQTIETLYARRLNPGLPNPNSINSYEYSVTDAGEEFTGTLQHRFGDGAWVLVQLILEDIHRQKQERIAYSPAHKFVDWSEREIGNEL